MVAGVPAACDHRATIRRSTVDLPAVSFRNLATWDRSLRFVVGVALLILGGLGILPYLGRIVLLLFGWIPVLTALLGWDPIYSLLRLSTYRR